jgi:aspartyl-tRNA(Asn)/glutamyl-tRNA(Gln) amidotransferase subunit C
LIQELQAADTRGVEPMSHAQDLGLRLREDRVTETDQHELFQTIAPQVAAGLYLVPKAIE